ncbi:MAG: serpin family protein [Gemmatimonadota bacterium]
MTPCPPAGSALRWWFPVLLPLVMSLPACDSLFGPSDLTPEPPLTELPRALSPAEDRTVQATTAFGLDLLREMASEAPGETVFLSPFSASMALGMALNGADGETWNGMRSALRLGQLDEESVNDAHSGLLELLAGLDEGVEWRVGNAIWHRDDLLLHEGFRDRVTRTFEARIQGLDFASPSAPAAINDWVQEATRGKIQHMAPDPIPIGVVAYLMNAIYFKGDWTIPFDARKTAGADFHLEDGSTAPIRLMTRVDTLRHVVAPHHAAVELPYSRGAFVMTVVVPRGESTTAELLASLDVEGWNALTESLQVGRVNVQLPRFELEWEGELNRALASMGMGTAFRPGEADFTRMFRNSSPWISEVKQKSFVRVDEVGTEAAAVTSVVMVESAPPTVRADRPFLLAIRERFSGTLLFLGLMAEAPVEG